MKKKMLKLFTLLLIPCLIAFPKKSTDNCKASCKPLCAATSQKAVPARTVPMTADDEIGIKPLAPGYCLFIKIND